MCPFIENVVILVVISCLAVRLREAHGLTNAQLKEVEKVRAELDQAFEKHEEEALAEKGVIVQPNWTKETVPTPLATVKVEVSKHDLAEVKALRAEINRAVSQGDFVASVAQSAAGDAASIRQLDEQFQMQAKSQGTIDALIGATTNVSELVGAVDETDDYGSSGGPNVVVAYTPDKFDVRKLQRLEINKRRTKELLILKSIEEDYSFDLGHDVEEWEYIVHGGEEYFIGRRETDLTIVQKSAAKYQAAHVLQVGKRISALETYSYWNHEQQQMEGVLLVASDDCVLWYRRSNTTANQIDLYWSWTVGYTVGGLTYFNAESRDYLVVPSNFSLSIYQFNLATREFWIAQRLLLKKPSSAVSVLNTGRDLLLAVAQGDSADVYTFNSRNADTDHIRFRLLQRIPSENVDFVTTFQMGGRSYMAMGGTQPQILLYQQGELTPRTILGSNFGRVELFLPVPVRTYRDDLLLFVQHRVDFESHTLTVLETLIWDGEAFEASIPVPCQLGNYTTYGASCMLDLQRDEGLKGTALLRRGDEVSLIVPRHDAESGLFRLHTELLAKNSELLDLREIFNFLKEWVQEQEELIAQANHFLATPDDQLLEATPDLSTLEQLKVPELVFEGELEELYINDYKWTDEDSKTDLQSVMTAIEHLEADIVAEETRGKRDITDNHSNKIDVIDTLVAESVEVEELEVEEINSDRFYIQDAKLYFPGTVFLYELDVLAKEDVQRRESREVNFDSSETFVLDGDLEFEHINGVDWDELRKNIVLLDEPQQLAELQVHGEVTIATTAEMVRVDTLNAMRFPADFLWTNSNGDIHNVVRSQKEFHGNLSSNAVDSDGQLVNGVSTLDVITLGQPQDWTGQPTFANLKVLERLEMNGTARDGTSHDTLEMEEELPPINPTLRDTNIIAAECFFKQLEIHGPVRLYGDFDGEPLAPLLADLVQRPTNPLEPIIINSAKTFNTMALPTDVEVQSNEINGIPVPQFVTLHTPQRLNISELAHANVYFRQLQQDEGTFDGVSIEQMLNTSIRLDEPVTAPTVQLNFVGEVVAPVIEVREAVNGVQIRSDYHRVDDLLEVHAAHFESLSAEEINVAHDVQDMTGSGGPEAMLNGVNLRVFLQRRDWLLPNGVETHVHVDELHLIGNGNLQADNINDIAAEYMMNFLANVDELADMVLDGSVCVDHIAVNGDVQLHHLNGQLFDEDVQMTAIWLHRPNYLSTELRFERPLYVGGHLNVLGEFNNQPLAAIMADMLWRDVLTTGAIIAAPKSFTCDVTVVHEAHVAALNGVSFERIATKRRPLVFEGSLRVAGNVAVRDLVVTGRLNSMSMSEFDRSLRYDPQLHDFVLLGTQQLRGGRQLQDLTLRGDFNGLEPQLELFFDRLVYKRHVQQLDGSYAFRGRVSIAGGVHLHMLNELDVAELLDDIVLVHAQTTPVRVHGPVMFANASNSSWARAVHVSDLLTTDNLRGCSLNDWLTDTLRVDMPQNISKRLRFTAHSLHHNDLVVKELNGIDLSQVITLHTPQNLSGHVHFSAIHLDGAINAGGDVNGIADLQREYDNTLLLNPTEPQYVTTPLLLHDARVLYDLHTTAPVNEDKDLHDVATLHGTQEFESPLYFENVTVSGGVYTKDLVSGIDLNEWQRNALWVRKRSRQWVNGKWAAQQLTVLNGGSVAAVQQLRAPRSSNTTTPPPCQRARELWQRQQQRRYELKYLERRFVIDLAPNNTIPHRIFQLSELLWGNFILSNTGCWSRMYQWFGSQRRYEPLHEFETGTLLKVLSLKDGEFVTLSDAVSNCSVTGLNAWQLKKLNSTFTTKHLHKYKLHGVQDAREFNGQMRYFYAVANATLHEFTRGDNSSTSKRQWLMDAKLGGQVNFVPHHSELMFTNGAQLYWLRENKRPPNTTGRFKRDTPLRLRLPLSVDHETMDDQAPNEPSVLRTVAGVAREMTYADFEQVLVLTLQDLIVRLRTQMNVTQLSIPEANLYDEHLLRDFLDVMAEIQRQRIYPTDVFASVSWSQLRVPGNPAQSLAAHIVLEAWPVIMELQELHRELRDDATIAQTLCACITANLGLLIRDVLLLANSDALTQQLDLVISRVRDFESYAEEVSAELQIDIDKRLSAELLHAANDTWTPLSLVRFMPSTARLLTGNVTLVRYEPRNFPTRAEGGEMLPLVVGSDERPLHLLAVSKNGDDAHNIRLYTEPRTAQVFQTVLTLHQPYALTTLRLRTDTLLAYVEDCCNVKVLIYRGALGFISFAHFKHTTPILQLLTLILPDNQMDNGESGLTCQRFYLAVVQYDIIIFYELVLSGDFFDFPIEICD